MTDSFRPTNLRAKARLALTNKWTMSVVAALVLLVIVGGASGLNKLIPFSSFLISIFVTNLISMGALFLWYDVSNGEEVEMKTFFEAFSDYVRYMVGGLLVTVYTFMWMLLLVVPGIIKGISYSMTYYIMRENPEMRGEDAINISMKMMDGHKMDYFLLQLSFIGWLILGTLALGIGLLWVTPYVQTANAEFYKELKKDYDARIAFGAVQA